MTFQRQPRFRRVRPLTAIQLTERDRAIIRFTHRHRFLRSSHILALMGGSPQQVLRRLQLLFHQGYLERPRAQIDYFHKGGTHPIVYGLGRKSSGLLQTELGSAFQPLRWGEKNRAVGRIFLEHALLVSDIMVALELGCRQSNTVRLIHSDQLFTDQKQPSWRWQVKVDGLVKLGLIPDRVFALERHDGDRAYFFLEADRGTMPVMRQRLTQTSFFRKLLAYEATWSQNLHITKFKFHRFRVLTVTKSEARVDSLVAACSKLKSGHGLFLFASKTVLEQPDILSAPWRTTKDGESTGTTLLN
jgi:hypothetical protein